MRWRFSSDRVDCCLAILEKADWEIPVICERRYLLMLWSWHNSSMRPKMFMYKNLISVYILQKYFMAAGQLRVKNDMSI